MHLTRLTKPSGTYRGGGQKAETEAEAEAEAKAGSQKGEEGERLRMAVLVRE